MYVRRRGGELLYALTDVPVAIAGALVVLALLAAGTVLLVLLVGLPILAGALVVARGLGRTERIRARVLLGVRVAEPPAPIPFQRPADWLRALSDPVGWRGVLYLLAKVPIAAVTTALAIAGYGLAGLGLSYPFWFRHAPMVFGSYTVDTLPRVTMVALAGLVLLAVTPFLLAGPLLLSRLTVRGLLGPSRLDGRLRALEQARGQALDESAAMLRRIERDLHDGTQARLVTLAMDLSHARELLAELPVEPAGLRTTIEAAHRNAQQAVTELRSLVGTIHPPVLDTGLSAALQSLTQAFTVPIGLRVDLPRRPAPAVETMAYFCAVELLGNVAKHSGAATARLDLTGDRRRLTLRVSDDGVGGAKPHGGTPGAGGTGLAGIAGRVAAMDGTLRVDSPAGGPTVVTVELPMSV